jgi:hypothetical protein
MNSAFRRMESAFQSGEVAGTATAMAANRGSTPHELPVSELQGPYRVWIHEHLFEPRL